MGIRNESASPAPVEDYARVSTTRDWEARFSPFQTNLPHAPNVNAKAILGDDTLGRFGAIPTSRAAREISPSFKDNATATF